MIRAAPRKESLSEGNLGSAKVEDSEGVEDEEGAEVREGREGKDDGEVKEEGDDRRIPADFFGIKRCYIARVLKEFVILSAVAAARAAATKSKDPYAFPR